jgi:thiol:disulfide interchange protein
MKLQRRALAVSLAVLVLVAMWPAHGADAGAEWNYLAVSSLKWRVYDERTLDVARKLQRPLFVLIYLDTCHWCRKYETGTLETPRILKRLREDYLPVAIDSSKQPELARRLGAGVVPTTLLLTPEGKRLVKFQGAVEARDLADILDANLYRWRKGEITGEEFGEPDACCPVDGADQR